MKLRLVVPRWNGALLAANAMIVAGLALMLGALAIHFDALMYQRVQEDHFLPAEDPTEMPVRHVIPVLNVVPRLPIWTEDPAILGRLEIPRLGLSVMIRLGDDAATLRRAVGLMPGTALPGENGNMVLTGHRDTFFRPLRGIERGDRIQVRTRSRTHTYFVDSLMVVEPTHTSVLKGSDKPRCTLITCFPFDYIGSAPRRFIVTAQAR